MLAENLNLGAGAVKNAVDRVGNYVAADPLHGDRRQLVCDQHASYQRVGFIADDDVARFRNRLQPRRQVRFGADDRVVHPVGAAEIADVAEAGVDAHPHPERVLDPFVAPLGI